MLKPARRRSSSRAVVLAAVGAVLSACRDAPPRSPVEISIATGATASQIVGQLADSGLVESAGLFSAYVRLRGRESSLKSGRYLLPGDASWNQVLSILERGEVVTRALTVPEGFAVRDIAPLVAEISGVDPDSVLRIAADSGVALELGVPGPTLEGYLFPDTYRFADGLAPLETLEAMVQRYERYWTDERRRRVDSISLSEREVVTLASIVEKEALRAAERPIIAGVYLNRLRIGMRLQADPTVQYALGEPRARLLYRDIESVAADPYNTYTHAGLPPGPIASPGEAALDAVLWPADVPYLFFVARPDGSHEFTSTQREHINAKNRIRRQRRR